MRLALRFLVTTLLLLYGAEPSSAAQELALERGAAIIDPGALRELDGGRIGLSRILEPARSAAHPLNNVGLFAVPVMAPLHAAIAAEFDRYVERHKAELPAENIGVGDGFDFQLFDRAQLTS